MLKTLIDIRMRSILSGFLVRGKGKSGRGKKILSAVLIAYIVVIFGGLFIKLFDSMYIAFTAIGMEWLYFSVMGIFVFIFCIVGSVFVTQQQIFGAKDNDMLLSMPVPVRSILLSRLLSIVLLNYLYEILVMGPGLGIYVYCADVNPVGLLLFLLSFLLMPFLVLAVSALFGWIIALIGAKTGKSSAVITVLTLILFLGYMYICFKLQDYLNKLIENGAAVGEAVKKALPPFYSMGRACAEGDFLYFLLFLAFCIIPFIIVYFVLSKTFISIATSEKGGKKAVYKERTLKVSGAKTALFKKDLRHFTGSPMYMFNCGIGLVFMLAASVYLIVKAEEAEPILFLLQSLAQDESVTGAVLCAILGMMASLTNISSPMISIEAKTLWISKSLPVSAKDVIFAKADVHIAASLPFVLTSVILLEAAYDMSLLSRVLLAVFPLMVVIFNAYMGIALNLSFPKFDWINEIHAIKQGAAPIFSVLIAMATIALPVLLYVFALVDVIRAEYYVLSVCGIFAAASLALNRYLAAMGAAKFEELQ